MLYNIQAPLEPVSRIELLLDIFAIAEGKYGGFFGWPNLKLVTQVDL